VAFSQRALTASFSATDILLFGRYCQSGGGDVLGFITIPKTPRQGRDAYIELHKYKKTARETSYRAIWKIMCIPLRSVK